MMLAESEGMLQRIVDEFDRICKRRKLKVNAGKSKVMFFEKAGEQTIDFAKSGVRGYTWMKDMVADGGIGGGECIRVPGDNSL